MADDFMGRGDRAKRQAEIMAQRRRDGIDLMKTKSKLAKMKPNEEPEWLPEWARR